MTASVVMSCVKTASERTGYRAWNTFSAAGASRTWPSLAIAKASFGTEVRCRGTAVVGNEDVEVVSSGRERATVRGTVDAVAGGDSDATPVGAPPARTATVSTP